MSRTANIDTLNTLNTLNTQQQRSRFELAYNFKDTDKLLNNIQYSKKPLHARLRQYDDPRHAARSARPLSSSGSFWKSTSVASVPSLERDYNYYYFCDEGHEDTADGSNPFNLLNKAEMRGTSISHPSPPAFNRSISLPSLVNREEGGESVGLTKVKQPSRTTSRKSSIMSVKSNDNRSRRNSLNSFFCNCTHHKNDGSRVSCRNSIVTLNSEDDLKAREEDDDDYNDDYNTSGEDLQYSSSGPCRRHHHRRGSVAIKFTEPELISGADDAVDENVKDTLESFELN